MKDEEKKVVLGTRVYQRVKKLLNERAENSNTTLSNYTEQILNDHCDSEDSTCKTSVYKATIDHLEKENSTLRLDNEQLKNKVSAQEQQLQNLNPEEDHSYLIDKIESLEDENEKLHEDIKILENQKTDGDLPILVSEKALFQSNLEYLQRKFPQYSTDELIELAVACTTQNSKNLFIVNKLSDFLKSNNNFFTSKTTPNASSDS